MMCINIVNKHVLENQNHIQMILISKKCFSVLAVGSFQVNTNQFWVKNHSLLRKTNCHTFFHIVFLSQPAMINVHCTALSFFNGITCFAFTGEVIIPSIQDAPLLQGVSRHSFILSSQNRP